ncbi:hypothetical protein C1752_08875 [Acaryochloris thomasi RCC1774]|uniref:SWIM-type domain-containing protein n=1 Tax=Acaryochloris thomasi RCC1774 TaxID=1764569 RepID=A0A2W1JNQ4_9CYAN|nr:hypothetical protein C1752_08875 [Acaryochloris thomasi RCC1774]
MREGRVLELTFEGPEVSALVQGTAPDPYEVTLSLDPFDDEQWSYVIEELSQRAIFAAKLLAGEMPQNIEEAFTASGLSLFPFSKFDIHSRCNCPDPVNPCKHIGAVYYLLGNQFSQDPFILFQLRGRTKTSIIEALRQNRSKTSETDQSKEQKQQTESSTAVKLDAGFWSYSEQLDPSLVVIAPPPTSETVIDVLGPMPTESFSQTGTGTPSKISDGQKLLEYLKDVYQRTGQQAMMMAMLSRDSD